MPGYRFEDEEQLLSEQENEDDTKEPPRYKVLLHNDDFTTMEFVVYVLQTIFQKSEIDAMDIMLKVHHEGIGIAGIYPFEIAETKVAKVTNLSQTHEFPLKCTMEEE